MVIYELNVIYNTLRYFEFLLPHYPQYKIHTCKLNNLKIPVISGKIDEVILMSSAQSFFKYPTTILFHEGDLSKIIFIGRCEGGLRIGQHLFHYICTLSKYMLRDKLKPLLPLFTGASVGLQLDFGWEWEILLLPCLTLQTYLHCGLNMLLLP